MPSGFRYLARVLLVAALAGLPLSVVARAAPPTGLVRADAPRPQPYELLQTKARAIADVDRQTGWSYIVSGGLALGLSIPAYYLSDDLFARVVYSLGQTLGVAAVGYGSYLVLIENDYARFHRVVEGVPDLSPRQRDALALSFLDENAHRARNVRKIRVISHGLTASLNFLNALTASQSELKTALFFLGGVNTLAAISFGLRKSEEEKLHKDVNGTRTSIELRPDASIALRITF